MQTQNYWKRFECTGKIEDYLNYKDNCGERDGVEPGVEAACRMEARRGEGTETDEGLCRNSYM